MFLCSFFLPIYQLIPWWDVTSWIFTRNNRLSPASLPACDTVVPSQSSIPCSHFLFGLPPSILLQFLLPECASRSWYCCSWPVIYILFPFSFWSSSFYPASISASRMCFSIFSLRFCDQILLMFCKSVDVMLILAFLLFSFSVSRVFSECFCSTSFRKAVIVWHLHCWWPMLHNRTLPLEIQCFERFSPKCLYIANFFFNFAVAIASLFLICGVVYPFALNLASRYSKLFTLSISSPSNFIIACS